MDDDDEQRKLEQALRRERNDKEPELQIRALAQRAQEVGAEVTVLAQRSQRLARELREAQEVMAAALDLGAGAIEAVLERLTRLEKVAKTFQYHGGIGARTSKVEESVSKLAQELREAKEGVSNLWARLAAVEQWMRERSQQSDPSVPMDDATWMREKQAILARLKENNRKASEAGTKVVYQADRKAAEAGTKVVYQAYHGTDPQEYQEAVREGFLRALGDGLQRCVRWLNRSVSVYHVSKGELEALVSDLQRLLNQYQEEVRAGRVPALPDREDEK